MVVDVVDGGPADNANIKVGDVIVAVNGDAIPHINALDYRLTTVGIGNVANFRVFSRGKRINRKIRLATAPETVPANETNMPARSALGGAVVANLSPAIAQRAKVPSSKSGVVTLQVKRNSPASANRIRPGDIIREVNGQRVKKVADLKPILSQRGRRWIIVVERQGREYIFDRNGGFFRQYTR
jgi:S1-C subfamily serine protease